MIEIKKAAVVIIVGGLLALVITCPITGCGLAIWDSKMCCGGYGEDCDVYRERRIERWGE